MVTKDVLVVDTESTDDTADVARSMGCKVLSFPYHRYVEPSREFAIQAAQGKWVLILDADECITPELAQEVKNIVIYSPHTHFYIPRKNIFARKKWLKYGGWYPDKVLRLMKKSDFKKWPHAIHSTPIILGSKGELREPFLHYFHPNLENMVQKQ
ncbi:MAG: Glycosyl transferase family 2 [Microgenomates bacterium OLB23]|nr:MAG: Glycosyl transferase family 2 [Microgenomates bacterium OLB23]